MDWLHHHVQKSETFMYHPHADEMVQMAMGGFFVVHLCDANFRRVDRDVAARRYVADDDRVRPVRPEPSSNRMEPSSMMRSLLPSCLLVTLALAPAAAAPGAAGHDHHASGFSAGEPGNPKKPARVVQIAMQEADGKMLFVPPRIEVRKGEQIKFVLRNTGALEHEFVLATTEENLKHAEQMKQNSEMEHDDPNAKRVDPNTKGEIVWKFTKSGTFEYGCLIPGHREAGMTGTIVVK